MIFVSDIHGAASALGALVARERPVMILGDLINLTDYRTGDGLLADVLGIEFARRAAAARASGNYRHMRDLWASAGDRDELRLRLDDALDAQYRLMGKAIEGGHGWVIHGNVDRPDMLRSVLPEGFTYVHGETVEVGGVSVGMVGGGVETPIGADGEVTDEEMAEMLGRIGEAEILCTHVPPSHAALRSDVITGRQERGSRPLLDHIRKHQPRFHLFGDVHQPKASSWRIGKTQCHNAGYFRATGRFLRYDDAMVRVGKLG